MVPGPSLPETKINVRGPGDTTPSHPLCLGSPPPLTTPDLVRRSPSLLFPRLTLP